METGAVLSRHTFSVVLGRVSFLSFSCRLGEARGDHHSADIRHWQPHGSFRHSHRRRSAGTWWEALGPLFRGIIHMCDLNGVVAAVRILTAPPHLSGGLHGWQHQQRCLGTGVASSFDFVFWTGIPTPGVVGQMLEAMDEIEGDADSYAARIAPLRVTRLETQPSSQNHISCPAQQRCHGDLSQTERIHCEWAADSDQFHL